MNQKNLILQNKLKIFERSNHCWPNKDTYDTNILAKETAVADVLEAFDGLDQGQKLACVLSVALLGDACSNPTAAHTALLLQLLQLGAGDADQWVATVSRGVQRRAGLSEDQKRTPAPCSELDSAVTRLATKIDSHIAAKTTVSGQLESHPLQVPLQLRRTYLGDRGEQPTEALEVDDTKCEYESGYLTAEFYLFRPTAFAPAVLTQAPHATAGADTSIAAVRPGLTTGERFAAPVGGGASLSRRFDSFSDKTAHGARPTLPVSSSRSLGNLSSGGGGGAVVAPAPSGTGGRASAVATLSFEQLMEIKNNPKKRKLVEADAAASGGGAGAGASQGQAQLQSAAMVGILTEYRDSLAVDDVRALEAFGARAAGLSGQRKIRLKESESVNEQGRRVKEAYFVLLNYDDNTWKKVRVEVLMLL
jgi:hypothetical protein